MFLVKNKALKYTIVMGVATAIVFSLKRTSTIGVFLAIIAYELTNMAFMKKLNTLRSLIYLLAICFIIIIIISQLEIPFGDLLYRYNNLFYDRGSGRSQIWINALSVLSESSLTDIVLGHGGNRAFQNHPKSLGFSVHNDFIEVLFDYGVLVFVVYFSVHYLLIKKAIRLIKQESAYAASFVASYIIFLVISMFSHLVIYSYFFAITPFWGMIYGITAEKADYRIVKRR
jgi:O-antigen ligase